MKSFIFASLIAAASAHLSFSRQNLFQSVYNWYPNAEFESNNFYSNVESFALRGEGTETYALEKCAYACSSNQECTAFTYDMLDLSCTGYKTYGDYFTTFADYDDYTGQKTDKEIVCEQCFDTFLRFDDSNISFVEHALVHSPKSVIHFPIQISAQECQLRCKDVKDCKVFTYDSHSQKCYGLKDTFAKSVVKTLDVYGNQYISGKKVTICPTCDFPDNIIVRISEEH